MGGLRRLAAQNEVLAELAEGAAGIRNCAPDGAGWAALCRGADPGRCPSDRLGAGSDRGSAEPADAARPSRLCEYGRKPRSGEARPYGSDEEGAIGFDGKNLDGEGFDGKSVVKLDVLDERIAAIWFERSAGDSGNRDAPVPHRVLSRGRCRASKRTTGSWSRARARTLRSSTAMASSCWEKPNELRSRRPSCRASPGCTDRAHPR